MSRLKMSYTVPSVINMDKCEEGQELPMVYMVSVCVGGGGGGQELPMVYMDQCKGGGGAGVSHGLYGSV